MKYFPPSFIFCLALLCGPKAWSQLTINGPETTCSGTPATLTAANCAGTLKWSTGETTGSITVSPATTTTYYVTCTVGTSRTTASLSPLVVPGFQLNSNIGTCLTDQATLSVTGAPMGSNLRWEKDGVPIPGVGSNNYVATQPGTYTVKSDIPTSAWTWQNLLPDGETFNDIYFATDLLGVAVGDYGKIVRTTDGGQTWSRVTFADKFNLTSVHFTSPSTGWITGRENIVLKTTDGGLTWSRIYLNGSYQNLSKIYFVDVDSGWILDRSIGGILKTTNGGSTWNVAYTSNSAYVEDIFFADASNGWLSIGNEVKKTTDGGSSWNTVLTAGQFGRFYKVFFLNASEGWAVGRRGLHKTTDGGSTWADYSGAVPFGLEFRDVYFSDSNNGTVVSSEGIYRTTNGGSFWSLTDAPLIDPLSVFMRSSDKAWVSGRGGRILTGNQSASSYDWKITLGYGVGAGASAVSQRTALDFVNKEVGWVGNGNDYMLKTTNGGKVWEKTSLKDVYDVDFVDENTGYAVAKGISSFPSSIYKSTDGGNSWVPQYNFANNSSPKIQFVNANTGWVVSSSQEIYRTTDGGNSWIPSPVGFFLQDLFFLDTATGWVCGVNGQAARTTDGGVTWTNMSVGISYIEGFYFRNSTEGWALGNSTRKTTDGGLTWTSNLINGNQVNFYRMDFADTNNGLALNFNFENNTGYVVYKSLDGGNSWLKQTIPTATFFTSLVFPDSANAWISDGRDAIMHYAAPTPTCVASITLQQSPPAPEVTTSTHNALCEGESITLTATGCGGTLSWSDGSMGSIITVTPYASTTYTAFCDTGGDCKGATYTGVAVIPKIRLDTASLESCHRTTLIPANVWPGIDINWMKDGQPIYRSYVLSQIAHGFVAPSAGAYTAEPIVAGAWASQTGVFTNTDLFDITFPSASVGFAVGKLGTILKTADGGTSWTTLPSGTTRDLRRIQMLSPTTGWVVVTNYLLKTTDGGNTWTPQKITGLPNAFIFSVAFANANEGWANGNFGNSRVARTTDGGNTWVLQNSVRSGIQDIHAINGMTAVAVGNQRLILKTTDGGTTWREIESGISPTSNIVLRDVHFTDPTHGWIVGDQNTILYTTDGGETWQAQSPPPLNGGHFDQVQFVDNQNGWIRGAYNYYNILTTNNGGQTWVQKTSLSDQGFLNVNRFFAKSPTEALFVGNAGLLARTTDAAATWQEAGNPLPKTSKSDIYFVNDTLGFVTAWQGLLLRTTNGGKNWHTTKLEFGNDFSGNDIFFFNTTHGWIVGSNRQFLRTTDGGITWTGQPLPNDVYLTQIFFASTTTGWGIGNSSDLYKTTDGGLTWLKQELPLPLTLTGMSFISESQGWLSGTDRLLTTNDGGATWTSQSVRPNFRIRTVSFVSPTKGWVIAENSEIAYRTTDGGQTWDPIKLDSANYHVPRLVKFVDENTGFVLADQYVYVTHDAGTTWKKTYTYSNSVSYNSGVGASFPNANHGWVIGADGSILSYHPAAASCPSAPIMVQPQSAEPLSTLISGDWRTPVVWSCGTVPTALDDVRVNAEHTVTLSNGYSAKAKSVELRGQIQYNANAGLQLGQ